MTKYSLTDITPEEFKLLRQGLRSMEYDMRRRVPSGWLDPAFNEMVAKLEAVA